MNTKKMQTARFTLNFADKKIIGTRASFNKAGKGFGPEYEELAAKIAAHPEFTMDIKEPQHKSNKKKQTYKGLNEALMQKYIAIQENAEKLTKEYTAAKRMFKDAGRSVYPSMKRWFLDKFPGLTVEKAQEAIKEYLYGKATAAAEAAAEEAVAPASETQLDLVPKASNF